MDFPVKYCFKIFEKKWYIVKSMTRIFMFFVFSAFFIPFLFSESLLEQGEKLIMENKPIEAKALLEAALAENPTNEKVYINLAFVYEQLGDHTKSMNTLEEGLKYSSDKKHIAYCNRGNNFYSIEKYTFAEELYTKAIAQKNNYPDPYLNRANARLGLNNHSGALADYQYFLVLYPNSPKRPEIEKMIALLSGELEQIEKDRLAEEQRKKELENLLKALENSSTKTENLSEGSESIDIQYEEEDILD